MLLLGVCFILYFLKLSNISENVQSFYKVSILKDFTKFTRKHLCRSIFFNKFAVLQPVTLFNKRLQCRCCLENFAKFTSDPRHQRQNIDPHHPRRIFLTHGNILWIDATHPTHAKIWPASPTNLSTHAHTIPTPPTLFRILARIRR